MVTLSPVTRTVVLLSKLPRDLYYLWQEHEHGVEGKKPARSFSHKERGGKNKWKYSHRFNFWKAVEHLIQRGYSSDAAIDHIYSVYGRSSSVTAVLNGLRDDKKRGGHLDIYGIRRMQSQ